jgi:hypothetical protein
MVGEAYARMIENSPNWVSTTPTRTTALRRPLCVAIDEAASLERDMRTARTRIRTMTEMLKAAQSLDHGAEHDGDGAQRSEQGAYLLALALDLAVSGVNHERGVDELVEVSNGSPMALLGARSRAVALQRELPDDKRARLVVELLTRALRRARVDAFAP